MATANKNSRFEVTISGRDDGSLAACYITLTDSPVVRTEELCQNVLLADYDDDGEIVGFEILAPVALAKLTGLIREPVRARFDSFARRSIPQELVNC